tara:strand:+ start:121 stop:456 length:336 start_codon:yes stop_codon:yes gene_type:complete
MMPKATQKEYFITDDNCYDVEYMSRVYDKFLRYHKYHGNSMDILKTINTSDNNKEFYVMAYNKDKNISRLYTINMDSYILHSLFKNSEFDEDTLNSDKYSKMLYNLPSSYV